MAASYAIHKVLSTGKRGKQMISVRFNGRTITRHTVNGVGRHPDDGLTRRHALADAIVTDITKELNPVLDGLSQGNKVIEANKNKMEVAAVRKLIPTLIIRKATIEAALELATNARDLDRTENPAMVRYIDTNQR